MKIIIDCELDKAGNIIATHVLDTDKVADNMVGDKNDASKKVHVIDMLVAMNADKSGMTTNDWKKETRIPGHVAGTTCWDVLVNQMNHPTSPQALRDLGFTK